MTVNLLNLSEKLIHAARQAGADAADCLASSSQGTDVELRQGIIEKLERSEAAAVGLRVFVGQASALVSGSVFTDAAITRLAEQAVAMARNIPADPCAGLASPEQLSQATHDLDLAATDLPDAAALQKLACEVEEAALAVAGVTKSGGAGASASTRTIAFATSTGFARSYQRSSCSFSVSAIAGEGTGMERDYDYASASHPTDLRVAAEVGRTAGERAVRRLGPRKVPSQTVSVIYDRRVASSLLSHLAGAINGAAIARGTSFLQDSLGQEIFSPTITIIDDPLRQRGSASRPFDGEGLPVAQRAMVEKGQLTGWFLDLRSARQLGLTPTGNAARGLGSQPGPSSSNFYMQPGKLTLDDMIASLSTGFYVTELIGNSVNPVTGDYSRGASGYWIEQGQLAYPVSGVTIAGNLKTMFKALQPASDLLFTTSTAAPSCLVEGMTLAGS